MRFFPPLENPPLGGEIIQDEIAPDFKGTKKDVVEGLTREQKYNRNKAPGISFPRIRGGIRGFKIRAYCTKITVCL